MKKQSLSLSGVWQLCWQDTGKGNINESNELWNSAVPCQVPGDVHIALTEAGIIEDPLVDVNNKKCKCMEEKEFWYKKTFSVKEEFLKDRTELVLEGLDLTADIWLNGRHIGSHNNAFIEKVIDVTETIRAGENTLMVRIDDGVYGVKDKPVDFMERSWNAEQPYRAWMLHLATPDGVEYTDNDFDLLPGEEKKVVVICEAGSVYEPELYSLNRNMNVVKK